MLDNVEFQDILANPKKYGAPTFEEYVKNPGKFKPTKEDNFAVTEAGGEILKKSNLVSRHTHRVFGYKCRNESEVGRIMADRGKTPADFNFKPELIKDLAGKYEILIDWELKPNKGGLIVL